MGWVFIWNTHLEKLMRTFYISRYLLKEELIITINILCLWIIDTKYIYITEKKFNDILKHSTEWVYLLGSKMLLFINFII